MSETVPTILQPIAWLIEGAYSVVQFTDVVAEADEPFVKKTPLYSADLIDTLIKERDDARAKAVGLWKLLDDIDTLDDAAREHDAAFRRSAYKIQRRRFAIMSGEEFDVLVGARVHNDGGMK